MDCHNCKHVGNIVGSAHRCCLHPAVNALNSIVLVGQICSGNTKPLGSVVNKENGEEISPIIKINPTGINGGWAYWPINFDPTWIETCLLFDKKE